MPLPPGTKLGPYEISSTLGAGGMGEVYRARDPRLRRDVAIKILHQECASDASRRARFQVEARAVAALNHPNILGVFDFTSDDGRYYIVSELVNGESLRARVEHGPIGIRELYRIAVQIADGLSAAHAAGIAHRDLKPENVMLTTDGRVKIVDFGLARQMTADNSQEGATRTQGNTMPGTVMGTVAYMSPEHVRGTDADHRSDQFSFGTMLYELTSGSRPFTRETSAQTMTAILTEEAPPLDSKIPAPLRWTIARCHEKDPGARYESTRDLYHDLRNQQEHLSDVFASTEGSAAPAAAALGERPRRLFGAVIIAVLVVGVFAGWWSKPAGGGAGNLRFTPMEVALQPYFEPRWSPDGKAFVYTVRNTGKYQVFLRYLNSPTPRQLTQYSDLRAIGWTPDGKRLLLYGDQQFFSLPAIGGDPEFLAKDDRPIHHSIPSDGKGYAAMLHADGKYFIGTATTAGAPPKRYEPAPFETADVQNEPTLELSPDHRRMLYFVDIPGSRLAWDLPLPAGRTAPRRVLPDLANFGPTPSFSWLPDSRHVILALQPKPDDEHTHLWLAGVDSGRLRQLTGGLSSEFAPVVSPDGLKILFLQVRIEYSLVSVALATAAADRVVTSELSIGMPAWASHQEKFVYVSSRNGPSEVWLHAEGWDRPVVSPTQFSGAFTNYFMNPAPSPGADRVIYTRIASDGTSYAWISSLSGGSPVRLTNESQVKLSEYAGCWSPDAKSFAYIRESNGKQDLAVVRTSGDAAPVAIRKDVDERLPEWSPDGQWIALNAKGLKLVSPDGKTERDMGRHGAIQFTFSKDSRLLYGIRRKDGRPQLFSIDIEAGTEKNIGEFDKELSPLSYLVPGMRFSISPDGKSILFPSTRPKTSLWMLEGFDPPSWSERLREMLPW